MAYDDRITVATRVGPIPCRRVGTGPITVLAVHGLLVDSRLWDKVAQLLAADATVLLPDLPLGAHRTPVPDRSRLNPPDLAGALVDILDGMGRRTAVLLGNDTGGGLSQMAAAAAPERFPALALTSCDAFEHFPPPLFKPLRTLVRTPGVTRALVRAFSLPPLLARPGPLNLLTAKPVDPALVADCLRPARTDPEIRKDLASVVRSLHPRHTLAAAQELRTYPGPVAIAWSRKDRLFPPADAERLAATLPNAELSWIDDALAFSPLDQPAAVAAAVSRLLTRVGQPAR